MYEKVLGFGVHVLMLMSITPVAAEERLVGTWVAVPDLEVTWTFYDTEDPAPDIWWIRNDGIWTVRIRGEVTSYLEYAARDGSILARPDDSYNWVPLGRYYIDYISHETSGALKRKKGYLLVDFGLDVTTFKKLDD